MDNGTGRGRCFFAVWPDGEVRDRLMAWRESIQTDAAARAIPGPNLHITLAFLGELTAPQVEAVRRVGAEIDWSGALLELDRIGYWQRTRIIWVGSRHGSEALAALAESLRDRLRRLGFRTDTRRFVPHVTLYRKARRRPRWTRQSIPWRINEFQLVESRLYPEGAHYEVLDRWSVNDDME